MKWAPSLSSLSRIRTYLRESSGRKRIGWAFLLGGLLAFSMPPFNAFPLLWICFPALIFLLQGTANGKQAFITGWSFAFGFLVFGLFWIADSMFVDIKRFWWAVPFSVAGLPALLALYYGFAAALSRKIGLSDLSGILLFSLLWFLADFARGHLFTGFPWIIMGYAWSGVLPMLQITSLMGIYGLTLLTLVAACLPASLENKAKNPRAAVLVSLFVLITIGFWGEIRLKTTTIGTAPNVYMRLVQPNIGQSDKWRESERAQNFEGILNLSSSERLRPVTHIFWPETAATYYLSEDAARRNDIASKIPPGASLVTGVIRREIDENGEMHYYNSLVALNNFGQLTAVYDKAHLVPFGEYLPFRKFLPDTMKAIAASAADFTSGPGAKSLRIPELPAFSPLICYEAIFPGNVVNPNDRPDFLLNITNDGWYGRTTGPYQHFAIARVRAIEEGLPLVRVANTGISGVIDPTGRIQKKLGLEEKGVLDSPLPQALPPTFFSEHKSIVLWLILLILFAVSVQKLKSLRKN